MKPRYGIKLGYDGLRNVLKNHCGTKWYQRFKGQDPIEFEVPPLLDEETIKKVVERMAFNKRCNRTDKRDYVLTGFIRCQKCNYALSGANSNGRRVYQHSNKIYGKQKFCIGILADPVEQSVMETILFNFVDGPSFEKAIDDRLPDVNKKKELENELKQTNKTIEKINGELKRQYEMEKQGKYPTEMMESERKQNMESWEKLTAEARELSDRINRMPDIELIKEKAELVRQDIALKYGGPDRIEEMTYEEKRNLLHWMFDGKDEDGKPYGIYINKEGKYKNTVVEFRIHSKIMIRDLFGSINDNETETMIDWIDYDEELGKNNKTNGSGL